MIITSRLGRLCTGLLLVLSGTLCFATSAWAIDINSATYSVSNDRLSISGDNAGRNNTVDLYDANSNVKFATVTSSSRGNWNYTENDPAQIPCRVRAEGSGSPDERNVRNSDQFPGGCGIAGGGGGNAGFPDQTDFKILMNYELGMHCTGFEFAYCCVLPAYNSILTQVVKPEGTDGADFPTLLKGDPNNGLDGLHRQTVLRDKALDNNQNFKKYVLKYWHDAQPRNDGRGKPQTSTLISAVESNSLLSWNTVYDSAALNPDGTLKTGVYNGSDGVVLGDGDLTDATDNYQNGVWNHLYFYEDLEGGNSTGTSADSAKIRLGVSGMVEYAKNCGPALHPMGPTGPGETTPDGTCGTGVGNVLTYSGDTGTVVFTQMKVLENLPIMLTSPDIWEALGLPLTPFEDSIDFFGDPGLVDEDSIRPYVQMKAQMYHFDGGTNDTPVLDGSGNPVIGFGTAPIDIPNCERCHSNGPTSTNTPNTNPAQWALVQQEYNFWNAFYNIDTGAGDSDWYSRLKSAAISMLHGHDREHGTSFTANYPGSGAGLPQNTRLGHESIICQKCHADNVIAVVKSATHGGVVIPPVTEALHMNHRGISEGGPIAFGDSEGRSGGCQGCHPAHRSSGDMSGYPITLDGENFYATADNRDANGGCFVGRDVHSNPGKDSDGAETPAHLNPVGEWLADNVFHDGNSANGGLWCTNCHQQLGQELWKAENVVSLVHAQPGDPGHVREPFVNATLQDVASGLGISLAQAEMWLDPRDPAASPNTPSGAVRTTDFTHAIWEGDPGLCDHVATLFGAPANPAQDGNVATIEVALPGQSCSTGTSANGPDCDGDTNPDFQICGTFDGDGDFSVNALDFCTTPDCVADAQATLANSAAVPVPFSAATDGRDHWLSAGEPHCADCHAAPYVEQSGNINAYPPFNYPRKASLMRYSRGHQDISCQGCHESIHGLYPVTPDIDTTSYAQAASLNHDGSHGPLKCGTCHDVDNNGIPTWVDDLEYNGQRVAGNFDRAVSWMHTFTAEANPVNDVCLNCHDDESDEVSATNEEWLEHAMRGRTSRQTMDTVEINLLGQVSGTNNPLNTTCRGCHGDESDEVSCTGSDGREWKEHLVEGRVSESVWVSVSTQLIGNTCGW
ncbi:MAG: hypothetical protein WBO37_10480 [Gammaproteobacteria bacterium]